MEQFPIDFTRINIHDWKDSKESFENLCKDFIIKHYSIPGERINLINEYPAIESPVFYGTDGICYGFQAKLLEGNTSLNAGLTKSFVDKDRIKLLEDDYGKINKLIIFSNKIPTKDSESLIKDMLKLDGLEIEFWCGKVFADMLRAKYLEIVVHYFDSPIVRKKFHLANRKVGTVKDLNDVAKFEEINQHEMAFAGKYITEVEKELAKQYQEEFLINKRLYCDTPSLGIFEEIEEKIVHTKFKGLEQGLKGRWAIDVEGVYEKFEGDLFSNSFEIDEKDVVDILAYLPDKGHRKGFLVNCGAKGQCIISADTEKVVYFISKI